jgi:putative RecB family exonuclease
MTHDHDRGRPRSGSRKRAGRAAETARNVGGLPYGCGVDIENAVDKLEAGASFGVAGDPPAALSPSRASDFMTCPLLYRFRVIDRIPEPPTPATARGTLVHAVLERLFDRPAAERTPAVAAGMVDPEWLRLCDGDPGLAGLFDSDEERTRFITDAHAALTGYFRLEDPRRLEPAQREWYVETELASGLRLRGYVDRVDATPAGDLRVVDYKTGKVPLESYEASALFQMKFYALVIWRLRGVIPRVLQLMYLSGNGEVLRYSPDEADLRATERKLEALWAAISRARETGDFRPRPSRLCDWCRHKALCPEFGGTLPPMPERAAGTRSVQAATVAAGEAVSGEAVSGEAVSGEAVSVAAAAAAPAAPSA